jgi:putative Holliday junction resolvase
MSGSAGRILALDVGERRIGLAVSDPLGLTAQGLRTLERANNRQDFARLAELATEWDVELILVGHPVKLSGAEGRQAESMRSFAAALSARLGLPVKLWDERLTTLEAQRVLRQSGTSIRKRARAVDRLAAVLLLQSYLDAQAYSGQVEGPPPCA